MNHLGKGYRMHRCGRQRPLSVHLPICRLKNTERKYYTLKINVLVIRKTGIVANSKIKIKDRILICLITNKLAEKLLIEKDNKVTKLNISQDNLQVICVL